MFRIKLKNEHWEGIRATAIPVKKPPKGLSQYVYYSRPPLWEQSIRRDRIADLAGLNVFHRPGRTKGVLPREGAMPLAVLSAVRGLSAATFIAIGTSERWTPPRFLRQFS
jgi:hypothetical protein